METLENKNELNPEQLIAAHHKSGPLLVLAGAGTGKTRVVTQRIIHLLDQGVEPYRILGLTFTNKAAGEMKERVHRNTNKKVLISTFHSLGARILRESIHHLGYDRDFTIYDEEDSLKVLKSCMEPYTFSDKKGMTKALRHEISVMKNNMMGPEEISSQDYTVPHIDEVYAAYQARLRESNAVDFDDLLYLPVKLFKEMPIVLEMYQNRWKYFLIDEYQDTNEAQYEMIKLLVGEKKEIFVVGDPDQSIYSWRGASIQNILNFEKDFPGAKVIRLEQNYRSTSTILNAANALIQHNDERYEKELWSEQGEGDKVTLYSAESDRKEAEYILDKIEEYRGEGISYQEMVIFYRTNFQSRVFEDHLLFHGIPYVIIGGISFYQRMEIKDTLAFLRMVHTGSDFLAFIRTVNLPKRGVGPATMEKLQEASVKEQLPILDYCRKLVDEELLDHPVKLNKKQKEGMKDYIDLILSLREDFEEGKIRDLIVRTIDRTRYHDVLKQDPETFSDRDDNLQELISTAAEWGERADNPTLSDFLSEISLRTNLDQDKGEDDRVRLMTLHNGKGLEFTITFMVGMEEDLFPHYNSKDKLHQLEEERRLCYVGMTRARQHLFLTHSRFRYMWGMLRHMEPSRFLEELPEKYLLHE